MGGVHIHHDHPCPALGEDIDTVQLGNGVTQRRLFLAILWRRWHGLRCKAFRPGCGGHTTAFVQGIIESHLVAGFPFLLWLRASGLSEMSVKSRGLPGYLVRLRLECRSVGTRTSSRLRLTPE